MPLYNTFTFWMRSHQKHSETALGPGKHHNLPGPPRAPVAGNESPQGLFLFFVKW